MNCEPHDPTEQARTALLHTANRIYTAILYLQDAKVDVAEKLLRTEMERLEALYGEQP